MFCSVLQCSSDQSHLSGIYGCGRKSFPRMSPHRACHCIYGICLFSWPGFSSVLLICALCVHLDSAAHVCSPSSSPVRRGHSCGLTAMMTEQGFQRQLQWSCSEKAWSSPSLFTSLACSRYCPVLCVLRRCCPVNRWQRDRLALQHPGIFRTILPPVPAGARCEEFTAGMERLNRSHIIPIFIYSLIFMLEFSGAAFHD